MKPILVFDVETTGLPLWNEPSEDPRQPHLVQLAALLVDDDTRQVISTLDVIVRPDGWLIPEDVAAVHGITTERAAALADEWKAAPTACTQRLSTPICQLPATDRMRAAGRTHYKSANLQEAYRHFFGHGFDGAHSALADVQACMAVYFAIQDLAARTPAAA